jgi:hypothetical protein
MIVRATPGLAVLVALRALAAGLREIMFTVLSPRIQFEEDSEEHSGYDYTESPSA